MNAATRPLVYIFLGIALMVVLVGAPRWFAPKELVAWRTDLDAALREASASKKPVFIDFTAAWCGPCQEMKRTTWADAQVAQELASGYVAVQLNFDATRKLAEQYTPAGEGVAIPLLVVLTPDGKLVDSTQGSVPPELFLRWLRGTRQSSAAPTTRP